MSWLFGKKDTVDRREPWQIAIDKEEERKKEEEKNKKLSDEKKAQEEYQRKVQELGKNFKCHCCGKPSRVPLTESHYIPIYGWETETHWDRPGDLERCEHCGQLTCISCLYKGICKTCALEMLSKH